MLIRLKRGFDVPISGAPEQIIHAAPRSSTVALLGADYSNLRHSLCVAEGERVCLGQTLFTDRRYSEIRYTSPGSGHVRAINLGAQRRLASVVVELDGNDTEAFPVYTAEDLSGLASDAVKDLLLRSGLWTAFRARPSNSVPPPDALPQELFVTAMDTNPLAADPAVIISENSLEFRHGLTVLSRIATNKTYLCKTATLPVPAVAGVVFADFDGPHPAGLPGTHIHYLAAATEQNEKWHIGYQDVIAIGKLFVTGQLCPERVVSLGGPGIAKPRLVRTRIGANLNELLNGESKPNSRVISGSVLSGRRATQRAAHLGRYHQQVTVLPELADQHVRRGLVSTLIGRDDGPTNTAINGWPGGMLPVEDFERVWPLQVPPVPLLRALLIRDLETARALGCLALDEEDLALCSYVCPAKYDYGSALRATLTAIERSA